MSRLLVGMLLFVAGISVGAAAVYWYLQRIPTAPPALPAPVATRVEPPPAARGDGTVWVALESGVASRRALGIIIRDPAVVLLRFEDFIRSERGWWVDVAGRRHELGSAVAYDLALGLLAFAVTDVSADGLYLSREDGALFLGRDVTLTTDSATDTAYVDSAAIEHGLNDYRYYLKTDLQSDQEVAAVILPQTGDLVGMATRPSASESWLAIDAGTLRDFLARPIERPVATLTGFSEVVFREPQGLAVEFDRLAATGRWRLAIDRGRALLEADPQLMHPSRQATLYLCVVQLARGLLAADRPGDALELIDTSVWQFGANEELLRVATDVFARSGRSPRTTIAYLAELDERRSDHFEINHVALTTVTREQVKAWVTSGDPPQAEAIGLLTERLSTDNDYALYHRLLGGLLFDAGRYEQAQFHLQRAVELDPQYAQEVARELEVSRQRRSVSTLVEVPLLGSGSALYVNARLNGSERTFRLLLDTGATYSAINTATLLRLGLNDIFARGAPPVELETANGRIFAPSFTLGSIDVNGAVIEQVPVVLLEDMGSLDGLLGLSFLQHFDVQIDQRANKLLLSPR